MTVPCKTELNRSVEDMKRESPPVLAVVVPCYNEEAVLEETARSLLNALDGLKSLGMVHPSSFIYCVDDGSKDRTWEKILALHNSTPIIKGLKLSKNAGHQNAVLAGMLGVKDRTDCAITIDADLQDDVSVMNDMIQKYQDGCEIVFGVREERNSDTFLKKHTALLFYKLMALMGIDMVYNHADYRLVSRRAIEELSHFREINLFLRGIFPSLGFKTASVYYKRKKRTAGETKYPLKKMIAFAFEGITSFSIAPMRLVTLMGVIVSLLSLGMGLWALIAVFTEKVVPGWASTVIPIYFLGGIQLLSIGIIGEYIGKIYKEVKARPRFIRETELF